MKIAWQFLYSVLWDLCILPFESSLCVCVCVYEAVYEVDGLSFMMITVSKGVQNQSNPNPNACFPSPLAISKVGID